MSDDIRVTDTRRNYDGHSWLQPSQAIQEMSNTPKPMTLQEMVKECFLEPSPGRYILVEDDFTYKGRVIIPDKNKRAGSTGIIVKMPLGVMDPEPREHRRSTDEGDSFTTHQRGENLLYRVGDRVLFGRYSGTPVTFNEVKSWRIVEEREILAKVNDLEARVTDLQV